jgi:DNA-directed RNA polymerase subunit RPC12/RpoP
MQYRVYHKSDNGRKYALLGFIVISAVLIYIGRLDVFILTFFGIILALFPISKFLYGSWDPIGYKCPECKKKINTIPFNLKDGDNISLYCPNCDIMWDTRTTYHDG